MRRSFVCIILAALILTACIPAGLADRSDGDLYTFCPYMCTSFYNKAIKGLLELDDTQAALIEVTSDGVKEGNLVYSDLLGNTVFIFGGVTSEFGTATTAYIYCSIDEDSPTKNIPMLIWASIIEMQYYGELKETGDTFLNWVNGEKEDGDTFTTPYFIASYFEEPNDNCTLLLLKL